MNAEPAPDSRPMYKYLAVLRFRTEIDSHEQDTETEVVTAPNAAEALTRILEAFHHRNPRHIKMYKVEGNASVTDFADEET